MLSRRQFGTAITVSPENSPSGGRTGSCSGPGTWPESTVSPVSDANPSNFGFLSKIEIDFPEGFPAIIDQRTRLDRSVSAVGLAKRE